MSSAYHATTEFLGESATLNRGGKYEAVSNGTPELATIGGETIGWETSDVPQLCASKSIPACVLAKAQQQYTDDNTDSNPIHVYRIPHDDADVDISDVIAGDFALLEEIRYNNPSESPINAEYVTTVTLPNDAYDDIGLIYYLPSPHIFDEWGEHVKNAIDDYIETGDYIPPEELNSDATRPDKVEWERQLYA